MNFLAHIFLSCQSEDLLIGNFITDFLSKKQADQYPPSIKQGIDLHRKIDSFTDNHPMVRQGTKRLQPHHHKYSAVAIDILYDYLLVKNWKRYSGQDFLAFTQETYRLLEKNWDKLPLRLQKQLPEMIADDWLTKYGTEEGMKYVFRRTKQRLSKPEYLDNVVENFMADLPLFDAEFNQFFPDVIALVESECAC